MVLAWLAWLFRNLQLHELEWPLNSLKHIVEHVDGFLGTVMRGAQYLSPQEWLAAVSSGNLFVKEWTLLAKTGVENGLPYLAKVRPKLHYLQHVVLTLEQSVSHANPAVDACFMDEDRLR